MISLSFFVKFTFRWQSIYAGLVVDQDTNRSITNEKGIRNGCSKKSANENDMKEIRLNIRLARDKEQFFDGEI
ncbi:MAG: hypothetical protein LBK06_10770 [Planctomycetaceae bacterium]|jgi:hypothetical protein|nr:hypothetical protein [Planctomycetaceae bacterium]